MTSMIQQKILFTDNFFNSCQWSTKWSNDM